MFQFPKQAEFNRTLPKSKIYGFARPTRAMKERIASGIQEIVWKYKLAPETVNLPARDGIQEIQVFEVRLKAGDIGDEILRTIDKAIPSPIVFQLKFGERTRFVAGYKRPGETGGAKNIVEAYFTTAWQGSEVMLPPVPVVLELASLYESMLCCIIPVARRPGELLPELVARALQLRAKERECRDLESRLRKECQFNRKIEINAAIRAAKTQLQQLAAP